MTPVLIAFLQLTDAAPLIVAREYGFAEAEGIDLTLVRTTSWATLRDRLVYGQVQAAQMLAPLAIAVTLGLSQQPAALAAPCKLNVNGNMVVMSGDFAAALAPDLGQRLDDPLGTAHDFAAAIGLFRRKPVIGVVHRFSSHALMLRYWLASAGIDPDRDVVLRVLPPSLMVEATRAGEIDGFIAGEPWGSVAVKGGLAEAVAIGERIWRRGIEKVLTFRQDWLEENGDTVDRLVRAVAAAAAWCDAPDNHAALAALLARPDYVDQPSDVVERAIAGTMMPRVGEASLRFPDFMLFSREATGFPWRSQALWIYSQLVRWGMIERTDAGEAAAGRVFRPDVYRRALAGSDTPMPGASMKVEGALGAPLPVGSSRGALTLGPDRFFDGRVFDPDRIEDYLAGFSTP
ncbi:MULTISPECIES: CmpA/NrtA family ABC transporter substrate-binding protein [Sphingomonas]|jgi:two-component system, oxyanion-binding sensor|uniref:NitT/TauT family transport system ATP-binding protein n=1 Tax=Sphingomonas aquatilis TaxID=93063 RepID=A0AAW3TXA4_9SPHN|nr:MULTISPECIES: CmpA/NrtA family ABC transporter substrate-binding protein [Sphingomonas]ANC88655.1 nitrate transporter [Sphingomonas sp. NIC1]AXJ97349.1 nitrate transporter [Sphingomonas sp. FARSPH]MBB3877401.1 NitT/TauT family transport system ATP-binding protein [Sphingomonas aquatilis]MBX8846727.1 ABC transporter substrate-binding protein [Sphingomonas melonis]MBX8855864.1 ABC transporter substrate-binding protein [Sphingomonas melonis]